jgi:Zn-dependent protease
MENPIIFIIIGLFILLFSSILHEIAHGYVAYQLGDPTAKIRGRLTLNPISHIDPYMSILMPLMFFIGSGGRIIFGGAKPVPVDPFNLRDGQKDLALVSVAGPLTNVILAVIGALLIHIIFPHHSFNTIYTSSFLGFFLGEVVQLNLLLAVFNLIPIPPLDGSKVFALILPKREAAAFMSMGNIGMLILFFLLFFPIAGFSLMNVVYNIMNICLSLLGF